jgi:uncharacterized 2Fe-2S/4Fe-4S cluster protein (DUF4445 family)
MAAAHRARVSVGSSCGGYGTCGECRVRIFEGEVPASEEDRDLLLHSDLEEGWRLACQAGPHGDVRCFVPDLAPQPHAAVEGVGEGIAALSTRQGPAVADAGQEPNVEGRAQSATVGPSPQHLGLAFDLGTTTVAAVLVDLSNGRVLAAGSAINRQAARGADVISRAAYAHRGLTYVGELQDLALECLNALVERLCRSAGVATNEVFEAVVAGNAIMLHLLLGVDPHPLAIAPFRPLFTESQDLSASDLRLPDAAWLPQTGPDRAGVGNAIPKTDQSHLRPRTSRPSPALAINPQGRVVTFPVISAYAGGDTVAGIHATELLSGPEPALLIDVGTNTEVALAWNGRLVTASAPAGPAFEGAGIRRGSAAIPGAITHFFIRNDAKVEFEVIGDVVPTGICGSGLVDILAELRRTDLLDSTGRLASPGEASGHPVGTRIELVEGHPAFRVTNEIFLGQKDVRELQSAIAAVAAACRIVLDHAGIEPEKLARVLLAGSFGASLNARNAQTVGLVPPAAEAVVQSVGNAAMEGAKAALVSLTQRDAAFRIPIETEYLELSGHPAFNDAFLEGMTFPDSAS